MRVMSPDTLALFLLSSALLAVTPGPTMLLALSNGMAGGWRAALGGMAGASLGSSLLITAVALGLGSLLATSRTLFEALRWLGIAYLIWLGWKVWRSTPQALDAPAAGPGRPVDADGRTPRGANALSAGAAFRRSLAVALSNPKAILFFAAFLPQFIDPARPQAAQFALLGALFVVIDTLVMVAYAAAGTQAARLLSQAAQRALNRVCAAGLWLLAGVLALARR